MGGAQSGGMPRGEKRREGPGGRGARGGEAAARGKVDPPDPLAFSASAPLPTIPAASSPRPHDGRSRLHASPFRSNHPAAAAFAPIRRSGVDLSRRPAASAIAQQEGSPSVGSWFRAARAAPTSASR